VAGAKSGPPDSEHPSTPSRGRGRRFSRPWEEPLESVEESTEKGSTDEVIEPAEAAIAQPTDQPPDQFDSHRLGSGRSGWDESGSDFLEPDDAEPPISEQAYLSATTAEYRDLAEEIARGDEGPTGAMPAVAATMAGVGTGLVDFADVTGRPGLSEMEVEQVEQAAASDLTLRIISALVLVGLFMTTLLLGGWLFTLFVGAVMVVAVGEFYATLRRHGFVPLALFGLLGALGAAVAAHLDGPGPVLVVLLATIVSVVLFFSVLPRRRPVDNAATTILGAVWVAPLALAATVRRAPDGVALILMIVLLTAFFDIGSYFAGRAIGRHPIAPALSPKKTWEGFLGGIVTAVAVASLLSTIDYFILDLQQALIVTAIVVVLAPLGDAAESMIKRSLGVKDMGSVLPGHGGMLDRIDALLLVVPFAYLYFRYLGLL
jgi:phosphatidate cytidylyltransferase